MFTFATFKVPKTLKIYLKLVNIIVECMLKAFFYKSHNFEQNAFNLHVSQLNIIKARR